MATDIKYKKLLQSFPGCFINDKDELIVHLKSNTYLCLDNCKNNEELNCKVLEWLSRDAFKSEPFAREKSNQRFHKFILDGINSFLETSFDFDDMEDIYTYIGNGINPSLTVAFVRSGYDMKALRDNTL